MRQSVRLTRNLIEARDKRKRAPEGARFRILAPAFVAPSLLGAHGDERVDPHGAASRNDAGDGGKGDEQQRDGDE